MQVFSFWSNLTYTANRILLKENRILVYDTNQLIDRLLTYEWYTASIRVNSLIIRRFSPFCQYSIRFIFLKKNIILF